MRPSIDELATRIFEANKARGWWDDMDRPFEQTLQLIVTEIAEATEAARTDAMDDHLPHLPGEAVELADAAIRLLDLAGRYGWKHTSLRPPMLWGDLPPAVLHWNLVLSLSSGGMAPYSGPDEDFAYSAFLGDLEHVCQLRGYDLWDCIEQKLTYSATRFDHSREARQAPGGKKF